MAPWIGFVETIIRKYLHDCILGLAYSIYQLQEHGTSSVLGVEQNWILILYLRITNSVDLNSSLNLSESQDPYLKNANL